MLVLDVIGEDSSIELEDFTAIVAGYTGRDQAAVNAHIQELAEIGVPAPPRTPMFYPVDSESVTTEEQVQVNDDRTSGEVEPVYIRASGKYYLGVGSDHTDRQLETEDIAESKKACPKPMGRAVVPVEDIHALELDDFTASSAADGVQYQSGSLSGLMNPTDVLQALAEEKDLGDGDFVVFGGTLPLLNGGFTYATTWELEIGLTASSQNASAPTLNHTYAVSVKG